MISTIETEIPAAAEFALVVLGLVELGAVELDAGVEDEGASVRISI